MTTTTRGGVGVPRGDGYEQAWAADRQKLKLGIPDRNSTKEEGIGRIVASKVYVGLLRPVEERDRYRLNLMIWIHARLLGVEYLTLRRPPAHTASTCKPQLRTATPWRQIKIATSQLE